MYVTFGLLMALRKSWNM